jgi:hypothetical protein
VTLWDPGTRQRVSRLRLGMAVTALAWGSLGLAAAAQDDVMLLALAGAYP